MSTAIGSTEMAESLFPGIYQADKRAVDPGEATILRHGAARARERARRLNWPYTR